MGDKEQILDAIANLQINIQNDIATLRDDINEKHKVIENEIRVIRLKQEINEDRIKVLEKEQRKRNLIIHGIPESESEENYFQLEERILKWLINDLKIECHQNEIDSIKRLGTKKKQHC